MTSETSIPPRRRQDILKRVRLRQANLQQSTPDDILEAERQLFAEDEEYVPQLLRARALLEGQLPAAFPSAEPETDPLPLFSPAPSFPSFSAPPSSPSLPSPTSLSALPAPQRDTVLQPPPPNKELSEFDRHHNAIRLYVIQQFEEGKKSREIAEMIRLTPHKLSRWYNQVKELPPAMRLWIPLFKEEEIGEWNPGDPDTETEEDEPIAAVVAPELEPQPRPARVLEPSPEAVRAAKKALALAEKKRELERDQEQVQAWIVAHTESSEDEAVASRLAALAFHREGWSLSRIGRALALDVSTISRWMSRAKQAEQEVQRQAELEAEKARAAAERALQKGMDQRRAEQKLRQRAVKPPTRRTRVTLPRPIVPLSPMARRSVPLLQAVLEQAEEGDEGLVRLPATSAIERERIVASLSMLGVQSGRPQARGKEFLIPLVAEEALYLRRMLQQS